MPPVNLTVNTVTLGSVIRVPMAWESSCDDSVCVTDILVWKRVYAEWLIGEYRRQSGQEDGDIADASCLDLGSFLRSVCHSILSGVY